MQCQIEHPKPFTWLLTRTNIEREREREQQTKCSNTYAGWAPINPMAIIVQLWAAVTPLGSSSNTTHLDGFLSNCMKLKHYFVSYLFVCSIIPIASLSRILGIYLDQNMYFVLTKDIHIKMKFMKADFMSQQEKSCVKSISMHSTGVFCFFLHYFIDA